MHKSYEMVIGIEVHVELKTESKIFCSCKTHFGQEPNTQVCPVCLGLPGSLPVLNKKVVEYAVVAGLATNCKITRVGKQDRKNYFYPDLAKAYQISQYDQPLCEHGYIDIEEQSESKRIGITRIHIEEDAGKLVHQKDLGTLIDYNRAGVPLVEIVSEPEMSSAIEAKLYLQKLRGILLYTGISDCKMNEGSFRCDINLSVRKKGESKLGTRSEMKNLNSFSSITKAIEHEFNRQVKILETGGTIVQETRKWDQDKNKSISMRSKEDAHDYRYFPDPDLLPIIIEADYIKTLQQSLPELPSVKKTRYESEYGLSKYDADQISIEKSIAELFEATVVLYKKPKLIANIIIGEIMKLEIESLKFGAESLAELIECIDTGIINTSIAKKVITSMNEEPLTAKSIIERDGLVLIRDERVLLEHIEIVTVQQSKIVADYLSGKEKALQALLGQVMRRTKGQADPEITLRLIKKHISS